MLASARVVDALERRPRAPLPAGPVVSIPPDFEAIRRADPAASLEIRRTTRRQLGRLFDAGLRPDWAGGHYVFTPPNTEEAA